METNNQKLITIDVNLDNYFGALAKVLLLLKKDYQEKTFIFDKDKLLAEVIKDLKVLQKNCVIKNRYGRSKK
jgi:hypothetical protein